MIYYWMTDFETDIFEAGSKFKAVTMSRYKLIENDLTVLGNFKVYLKVGTDDDYSLVIDNKYACILVTEGDKCPFKIPLDPLRESWYKPRRLFKMRAPGDNEFLKVLRNKSVLWITLSSVDGKVKQSNFDLSLATDLLNDIQGHSHLVGLGKIGSQYVLS